MCVSFILKNIIRKEIQASLIDYEIVSNMNRSMWNLSYLRVRIQFSFRKASLFFRGFVYIVKNLFAEIKKKMAIFVHEPLVL